MLSGHIKVQDILEKNKYRSTRKLRQNGEHKSKPSVKILKELLKGYAESITKEEGGGPSYGYFEDIEGSWPATWRTGSSLMSWMILFDTKGETLKVLFWYHY